MPKYRDNTSIGGAQEHFLTTHWSEVFSARTTDEDRRKIVIESLLQRYWKPIYCFIRRKGYSNEVSKDLTQGFFCEIVLNSSLIQRADKAKGKFRTFLLTALDCFLADTHRKEKARKCSPPTPLVSLQIDDMPELSNAHLEMSPDQVFNYVWATEVLDKVIDTVKNELYESGKKIHWKVFQKKILVPITENTQSPSLKDICEKYKIQNESKASNMIITVKRCFRRVLEDVFRSFVSSDSDLDTEINELFKIISNHCAE